MITAPPITCAGPTGSSSSQAPSSTAPNGTRNCDAVTRVGPTRRIALNRNTLAMPAASAPEYRIASTDGAVTVTAGDVRRPPGPNSRQNTIQPRTAHAVACSGSTWRSILVAATVYTAHRTDAASVSAEPASDD